MNNVKLTRREKVEISQRNKNLLINRKNKKLGICLAICGLAFFILFGNMWLNRNNEIPQTELKTIEGELANKLELKFQKTSGNSMTIRLKEYPKINFTIGRFSVSGLRTNILIENISIGDKIQIDIMRKDFESINKPSYWNKSINVYGVRDRQLEYLNVSAFNRALKRDRNSVSMYLLLGFSIFIFGYGLNLWHKNI